jgi:hypothetical protein
MTFNTTKTSATFGNTGLQKFAGNTGKYQHMILVPKNTEIDTKADALDIDTWVDNINESPGLRWFVLPLIWNGEPNQEANVKQASDFGYEDEVRKGKLNYTMTFTQISTYDKTQINKLDGKAFDCFISTDKEFFLGRSVDGVKFLPIRLDYFSVLPETQNTGSEVAHVQAEVRFSSTDDLNLYQVALNPYTDQTSDDPWLPSIELPAAAIKNLQISINTFVAAGCNIVLQGYDSVPYSGAVKEDLYLRKTTIDGAAISITSLTESLTIPGTYAAVFGAQTTGTFYASLYDQPTAATQGFETPEVATITVTI